MLVPFNCKKCTQLNPFITEPQVIFLLLENDNLGITNFKFVKNTVVIIIITEFPFTYQTNSHIKVSKKDT